MNRFFNKSYINILIIMKISKNSIFDSKCEFIVNSINTVGAMGTGLALDFRLRIPEMYYLYKQKCEKHEIKIGKYWIYSKINRTGKKVLNFPTKKHFIHPSKSEYIIEGLEYFRENYKKDDIISIAFPLLGARNGKINADYSYYLLVGLLDDLPINIEVCEGKTSDKFTLFIKKLVRSYSIDDLCEETRISKEYCNKIQNSINNVKFLTDFVEKKVISVQALQSLYNFGYRQLSKNIYSYFQVIS